MATLLEYIALNFSNPILLLFITKQNTYTKITAKDNKVIFIKVIIRRFIKSFNKTLLGKHIYTIHNR